MKVIEHGSFYRENRIIDCVCGCKFEYEQLDICIDTSLSYTTCPAQYRKYLECPECRAKIELGTTYQHNTTTKY